MRFCPSSVRVKLQVLACSSTVPPPNYVGPGPQRTKAPQGDLADLVELHSRHQQEP